MIIFVFYATTKAGGKPIGRFSLSQPRGRPSQDGCLTWTKSTAGPSICLTKNQAGVPALEER